MLLRGDRFVAGTVPRMLGRLGLLEETGHMARGKIRIAVLVIFLKPCWGEIMQMSQVSRHVDTLLPTGVQDFRTAEQTGIVSAGC